MRIGGLANASGVRAETIRYYERLGLLPLATRAANGYRQYGEVHVQRLVFIRHCRALDMSLSDIQCLLRLLDCPEADCAQVNALVDAQLARVRQQLSNLHALEQQLLQLRRGCTDLQNIRQCGIVHALFAADEPVPCRR